MPKYSKYPPNSTNLQNLCTGITHFPIKNIKEVVIINHTDFLKSVYLRYILVEN